MQMLNYIIDYKTVYLYNLYNPDADLFVFFEEVASRIFKDNEAFFKKDNIRASQITWVNIYPSEGYGQFSYITVRLDWFTSKFPPTCAQGRTFQRYKDNHFSKSLINHSIVNVNFLFKLIDPIRGG